MSARWNKNEGFTFVFPETKRKILTKEYSLAKRNVRLLEKLKRGNNGPEKLSAQTNEPK